MAQNGLNPYLLMNENEKNSRLVLVKSSANSPAKNAISCSKENDFRIMRQATIEIIH